MINGKRIAFFGCKNTTKDCIRTFLSEIGQVDYLITISPEQGKKSIVAGYMDLKNFAKKNNIEVYTADKYSLKSNADQEWIKSKRIDLAFAIGWQRLIPAEVLNAIRTGVFGMHGSADNLPKGRGRSPMNWAIILDRKQFYTNLFNYSPDVDEGGTLDTQKFDINDSDTIETLHFKNRISMNRLIKKNIKALINNDFKLKKQDEKKATYFPKRIFEDGYIDWNLKTRDIYNLVRAVTKPFHGAFSYIDKTIIHIWRLSPFTSELKTSELKYEKAVPGQIVEVFYNGKFAVKTRDSCVLVHEYDIGDKSTRDKRLIRTGVVLKSRSYKEIFRDIESRYYDFVKDNQKEITVKKMTDFYEG